MHDRYIGGGNKDVGGTASIEKDGQLIKNTIELMLKNDDEYERDVF